MCNNWLYYSITAKRAFQLVVHILILIQRAKNVLFQAYPPVKFNRNRIDSEGYCISLSSYCLVHLVLLRIWHIRKLFLMQQPWLVLRISYLLVFCLQDVLMNIGENRL